MEQKFGTCSTRHKLSPYYIRWKKDLDEKLILTEKQLISEKRLLFIKFVLHFIFLDVILVTFLEVFRQYNVTIFSHSLHASLKRQQLKWTDKWHTNNSMLHPWFPQTRIYYFPGHFQNKITLSWTKCTWFKGDKSRYVQKSISYLFNVWWIFDIFMAQPPPRSIHFYLILTKMGYQDFTNNLFPLQLKFSSTSIICIHGLFYSNLCGFFHRKYFFPGHFLILQNSSKFPGAGKGISYFPGFPRHAGILYRFGHDA